MKMKCCQPIFWKHDEGWDVYKKTDCTKHGSTFVPTWFDCAIIEDAKTKSDAMNQLKELHPLGICLETI